MKAFPCRSIELEENRAGMDLRDYFAAKAMQVFLTAAMGKSVDCLNIAENAYFMADAMMKARE